MLEVERPALVLGSTQSAPPTPSRSAEAIEFVRRRSGGGAVLLRPGETVWVDVVIPRHDPLWDDDVGRSFHWLGQTWVTALTKFSVAGLVHRGALLASRWSSSVCFAGIGAGEVVVVGRDGGPHAKVVGMASRRTRHGALFQCAVPLAWEPATYVDLLGLPAEAAAELAGVAAPVAGAEAGDVADALVAALPT